MEGAMKTAKPKTVNVACWGSKCKAMCTADGRVWVYDDVAKHYTTAHSLTDGQLRYVRGRVAWQSDR